MLLICSDIEADAVMSWRAGEASRPNGPISPHDFVPSRNAPVYLTEKNIVGELAPADFHGIPVLGSWGETWLCRTPILPPGCYRLAIVTRQVAVPIYHHSLESLLIVPPPTSGQLRKLTELTGARTLNQRVRGSKP